MHNSFCTEIQGIQLYIELYVRQGYTAATLLPHPFPFYYSPVAPCKFCYKTMPSLCTRAISSKSPEIHAQKCHRERTGSTWNQETAMGTISCLKSFDGSQEQQSGALETSFQTYRLMSTEALMPTPPVWTNHIKRKLQRQQVKATNEWMKIVVCLSYPKITLKAVK